MESNQSADQSSRFKVERTGDDPKDVELTLTAGGKTLKVRVSAGDFSLSIAKPGTWVAMVWP